MTKVRTNPVALQLESINRDTPRLFVFEYDLEYGECASVRDIVEGPREFIEEYIAGNYSSAPVFVRVGRPNVGEMRLDGRIHHNLDCDNPSVIVYPAGKTPAETFDTLMDVERNPPPSFESIMPKVSAQTISDLLLSGAFNAPDVTVMDHPIGDEVIAVIRAKGSTNISVMSEKGHWRFDINTGEFSRVA